MTSDETDLVREKHACPTCGERDVDLLICREEDSYVICETCGAAYDPVDPR